MISRVHDRSEAARLLACAPLCAAAFAKELGVPRSSVYDELKRPGLELDKYR